MQLSGVVKQFDVCGVCKARFRWGMHYVHMSNTISTQVCLVLICFIQGLLCSFFSPQHDLYSWLYAIMKTVSQLERSFLATLTAFVHLLGLLHRQILEGLQTAAPRGEKTLHKAAFIHGGSCMGAWPLEIKTQYVSKYPRKCRHRQLSLDRSTQLLAILLLTLLCSVQQHYIGWATVNSMSLPSVPSKKAPAVCSKLYVWKQVCVAVTNTTRHESFIRSLVQNALIHVTAAEMYQRVTLKSSLMLMTNVYSNMSFLASFNSLRKRLAR